MSANPTSIRARRGLTLAELILGTAMLGIVMMAAAGLMTAVAAGWKSGDTVARVANVGDRAGLRVEESLAAALYVLQVKAPASAGAASYVFYWKSDGVTGVADGKAQLGEMALIEFDPTTKAVRLYEPLAASAMTAVESKPDAARSIAASSARRRADARHRRAAESRARFHEVALRELDVTAHHT